MVPARVTGTVFLRKTEDPPRDKTDPFALRTRFVPRLYLKYIDLVFDKKILKCNTYLLLNLINSIHKFTDVDTSIFLSKNLRVKRVDICYDLDILDNLQVFVGILVFF